MKLILERHGNIVTVAQIGKPGDVATAIMSRFSETVSDSGTDYKGSVGTILQLFTDEIMLNSFANVDTDSCTFPTGEAAHKFLIELQSAALFTEGVTVSWSGFQLAIRSDYAT